MKNEITAQRAQEFGLPPQGEGEGDGAFRSRVAGAIREKGDFIEAHEAQCNRLYNDPGEGPFDDPMNGIIGAMAMALHGRNYNAPDGEHQVGNEIAAGTVIRNENEPSPAALMMAIALDCAARDKRDRK